MPFCMKPTWHMKSIKYWRQSSELKRNPKFKETKLFEDTKYSQDIRAR